MDPLVKTSYGRLEDEPMKVIELHKSVTESNDKDAEKLRNELKEKGTFLVNIMSSPGSGKTTMLMKTIQDLKEDYTIGVMEADIDASVDAERVEHAGALSIQVHTDGMCHMDAGMTSTAFHELGEQTIDIAFLENVGNLICPAEYDTGAVKNVMILSITEGDDKPLKYPLIFETSDALLVSKIDTKEYFDFDFEKLEKRVHHLNPNMKIFPISAKTGEGMQEWENWLKEETSAWKK